LVTQLSPASWLILRESTTAGSSFDAMEALVLMAVAVLIVVVFDGALLAHTRRHDDTNAVSPQGAADPGTLGPSIDFGDHR
jgi:hypothetical protein